MTKMTLWAADDYTVIGTDLPSDDNARPIRPYDRARDGDTPDLWCVVHFDDPFAWRKSATDAWTAMPKIAHYSIAPYMYIKQERRWVVEHVTSAAYTSEYRARQNTRANGKIIELVREGTGWRRAALAEDDWSWVR